MLPTSRILGSLFGWLFVWAFWLLVTQRFHPTFSLAVIVTTSLICAYAAAAYSNHLWLVPRLWLSGNRWRYLFSLATMMSLFTALALVVIRASYLIAVGPDPDPYGWIKHFAIDLFGMIVHVAGAEFIVLAVCRFGLMRICNGLLTTATAICAIVTIAMISAQPNLEQWLKHIAAGHSMPDAFNHMNKAVPMFLVFFTLSLALLREIILKRRYAFVLPLVAGPVMCAAGLIFTEDTSDPNWASILAVITIGMFVSCCVTTMLNLRIKPRNAGG